MYICIVKIICFGYMSYFLSIFFFKEDRYVCSFNLKLKVKCLFFVIYYKYIFKEFKDIIVV